MGINSLIRGYVDNNIKPIKEENEEVRKYYDEIKALLQSHNYYCFRSWSYARWTAITPVHDLDIICECNEDDVEDFKNSEQWKGLYKILSGKYWEKNVDFQSSSIWISFWKNEDDFWIDVVVAIKMNETNNYWDNLYKVPKLLYKTRKQRKNIYKDISEKWESKEYLDLIQSDPKWYKREMIDIKEKNKNIIYATRFLKKWKGAIKEEYYWENEKCFKSFHIEEVVKKAVKWDMGLELLDLLKETIKTFDLTNANIPDRADDDRMIDSYVDEDDFNKNKWLIQLENIFNNLQILDESNFEDVINKIFLTQKEEKNIQIGTKQKSYYAS